MKNKEKNNNGLVKFERGFSIGISAAAIGLGLTICGILQGNNLKEPKEKIDENLKLAKADEQIYKVNCFANNDDFNNYLSKKYGAYIEEYKQNNDREKLSQNVSELLTMDTVIDYASDVVNKYESENDFDKDALQGNDALSYKSAKALMRIEDEIAKNEEAKNELSRQEKLANGAVAAGIGLFATGAPTSVLCGIVCAYEEERKRVIEKLRDANEKSKAKRKEETLNKYKSMLEGNSNDGREL